MHICFLCNEYPPGQHGGVGSVTQTIARALAARGHRVTAVGLYSDRQPGVEDDQGVQVVRLAHTYIRGAGFLLNGTRLRRALSAIHRETLIDILEGPENAFATLPRQLPWTTVIRMHGGHHFFSVTLGKKPRLKRSWFERRSFARADHLCAVSDFVARTTVKLLHLNGRMVEILPNPVDVVQFRPRPDTAVEHGLIVFTGTIIEKKGVRQLVEAMPAILKTVPDARLLLAGRDSRDPETGRSYADRVRSVLPDTLRARVVFAGPIEHARMPVLLARAAVCVYPSHMEALPIAWLEGLAMGKPVVASRTGPGPEVIEDGVSGLLCDPRDPGSIAAAISRVLTDPELAARLGDRARQRAVDCFSERAIIDRNERFYGRCVQAPRDFLRAGTRPEGLTCPSK